MKTQHQLLGIGFSVQYVVSFWLLATIGFCLTCEAQQQPVWKPATPAPNTRGQVENISNKEVSGAINAVTPHPSESKILYIGAVNGGVWKTENATDPAPNWKALTDHFGSLSIGALEFDMSDPTLNTLVAGVGRFSSFGRRGGNRTGLLITTDGGENWDSIDGSGILAGMNISGVAKLGKKLVVTVNTASSFSQRGVWRSEDLGTTWKKISGDTDSGLPLGRSFDLISDPNEPQRLFTNAGTNGIFKSNDFGANWFKVSNADLDNVVSSAIQVEIACGKQKSLFVTTVGGTGQISSVFASKDLGDNWDKMDLPTVENVPANPGGQGSIHLSIAADPNQANLVYIGGDIQVRLNGFFPNAIGANDFTGNLMRGDASKSSGKQWVHLTHSNALGPAGGGTANRSAPHGDSRDMDFAANGVLIEGDDGGVYKRTKPQEKNLQIAEFHSACWDAVSNVVVAGAQDTGTAVQEKSDQVRAFSISTGDGGVVAVDDTSADNESIRYTSFQKLLSLRRRIFDDNNVQQSSTAPSLFVTSGDPLEAQFYTPLKLNSINPDRMIIGAANGIYESLDQAETIDQIANGIPVNPSVGNPIAYGAKSAEDTLYIGSSDRVFVRFKPDPEPLVQSISYPGGLVVGIANHIEKPKTAFVVDSDQVFETSDGGGSWTDLTANLSGMNIGALRSIALVPGSPNVVVVGADRGAYMRALNSANWQKLGIGLPNVPIFALEFDAKSKKLMAGTLGRGAWITDFCPLTSAVPQGETVMISPPSGLENNGIPGKRAMQQLFPGVIVDSDSNRVFLMKPKGGVQSVSIVEGETIWASDKCDKPIGLVNGRIIALKSRPNNELRVVALDPATGEQKVTGAIELPETASGLVDRTLDGKLEAVANVAEDEATVTWTYQSSNIQGKPRDEVEQAALPRRRLNPVFENSDDPQTAVEQPRSSDGQFKFNLASGETSKLSTADAEAASAEMPNFAPQKAAMAIAIPEIAGRQFVSSDGLHTLVSNKAEGGDSWFKYELRVFENESRDEIGKFRSSRPVVPFKVIGSTVLVVTESYERLIDGENVLEPRKLRAFDLENGNEIWSREIRDTRYNGPVPG